MSLTPSPFDQLLRLSEKKRSDAVPACFPNRTAQLLHLIDINGPSTTSALRAATGMRSKLIWGLLQHRIKSGVVTHSEGLWRLNAERWEREGEAVRKAMNLLKRRGFIVTAPEGARDGN